MKRGSQMTNERRKQIRKRRKAKNKSKVVAWFKGLSKKKKAALIAGVVVLLLMLAVVLFVAWKFSKLNTEKIDADEIITNDFVGDEPIGVGYTNFVLFGGDSRHGDVDKDLNTDSIIIVSLNNETKEIKMVSVYRDTLLDLTNGSIQKCNSAYSRGGATQAINMLNMNLDLNIQKYVTVDFGAVVDVIDMLGGIEVDVSEAEWKAVNKYIDETGSVAGKKANHLTHAGVQLLDGVQATTYARIRKGVGDDYARTERQRLVIQLAFEKALKSDLVTLNKIIDAVFPKVATNLTMSEILGYAKSITKYKIGETSGFPIERGSSTIPGKGSCVYPVTLKKNVTLLHEFLFGETDYQPSSKVVSISGEIASIVGNRGADANTTWTDNSGSTTTDDTTTDGNTTNTDKDTTNTDKDNTGTDKDNTGTDKDNTGTDKDNTGTDKDNTGTDKDNTGTDKDNTGTGGDTTTTPGGDTTTTPGGDTTTTPGGDTTTNPSGDGDN